MGRTDILPATWKTMKLQTKPSTNLDEQFEDLARAHGMSIAQLKTIYLRGVEEFLASDLSFGSASMYGLARVQRYVLGDRTLDADLNAVAPEDTTSQGIEFTVDSASVVTDLVYDSGKNIAAQFQPGEVTGISIEDDMLYVEGTLGTTIWTYELNFSTGDHSFKVQ